MIVDHIKVYLQKKNETPKPNGRGKSKIEKGMIIAFINCFQNIILRAQIIGQPRTTILSPSVRPGERHYQDKPPNVRYTLSFRDLQDRKIIALFQFNLRRTQSDFRDQYGP